MSHAYQVFVDYHYSYCYKCYHYNTPQPNRGLTILSLKIMKVIRWCVCECVCVVELQLLTYANWNPLFQS